MSAISTQMLKEAGESAEVTARFLAKESDRMVRLGRLISRRRPTVVTTAARGSSDHAAAYFKYLFEIHTGLPVASIGPSTVSLYKTSLHLAGALHVSVSQSGASPDIVALQAAAKEGGAMTLAFVNATDSPLGQDADVCIPLHAGPEVSVAATKSFIASAAALAALTAAVAESDSLWQGLRKLPDALGTPPAGEIEPLARQLVGAGSLFTTGRGPALPMALEAALKAKETAALHAEAFSLAELQHGPMGLIEEAFPVLAFLPQDAAFGNAIQAIQRLAGMGASVGYFSTTRIPDAGAKQGVVTASTGNPFTDSLVLILAYYRFIEQLARLRGYDPDRPRNLSKVTRTI